MRYETITAPTMDLALLEVKRRFGADAVIVGTRTVTQKRWLGLRRIELIEVTAGPDRNAHARQPPPHARPHPHRESATSRGESPASRASPVQRAYAESGGVAAAVQSRPGAALLETPAVTNVAILKVARELDEIKSAVTRLASEVRVRSTTKVPDELFEQYTKLLEAELSDELAGDILRTIQLSARPDQLANAEWVNQKVLDQIEKLIPVSGPITRSKPAGPHVVALVGPTGVGKTTTIAKLAANLRLREHRRVGLITIDTYRIAAVDQLRRYAELMGAPLQVVATAEEIAPAIKQFSDCEYVLIDTAGRSPGDQLNIRELSRFIELAKPDEVHLVLSTTCSRGAVEQAVNGFGLLPIDKVIFTKIDEAAQVGVILAAIRKLKKGLSYVTTGQDVPHDIEVGEARRLAKLIMDSGSH